MGRQDRWVVDLLDLAEQVLPVRLRLTGGSLTWVDGQPVTGTGTLNLTLRPGQAPVRWDKVRIRIQHDTGRRIRPLGIWVPQVGAKDVDGPLTHLSVPVADKTELLNRPVGQWRTWSSGTVITTALEGILQACGIRTYQIAPSTEALPKAVHAEPGETWLAAATRLAEIIRYAPLRATLAGLLVWEPEVPAEQRPSRATYGAGTDQLRLTPHWKVQTPLYRMPTGVVINVARPAGLKGWIGRADLPDEHPLSAVSRGDGDRALGEHLLVETGDTTSAAKTQTRAQVRLVEETTAQADIQIQHPLDGTEHRDTVTIDPENATGRISARTITIGTGAICQSTIRASFPGGVYPWISS